MAAMVMTTHVLTFLSDLCFVNNIPILFHLQSKCLILSRMRHNE